MKIIYILLMIAGPILILEGTNIFFKIAGMFLLLISAVMLSMRYKPNPGEYDKVEQAIDPTASGSTNRLIIMVFVIAIVAGIAPGIWATAVLAQEQWEIGGVVLLIWTYPYWLLLNYFNKRSLLKVRLSFSLITTFLILVFTFLINK